VVIGRNVCSSDFEGEADLADLADAAFFFLALTATPAS
jgi:hypothetical protein